MAPERRGSKKQFNELPTPKEKISIHLFDQLLKNRERFVRKEMVKMKTQNPYLWHFFILQIMSSPDTELSLDWGLLYYAIHSRSAGKKDMPKVSGELTNSKFGELRQITQLEGIRKSSQELDAQLNRFIDVDKKRSPDLEIYWELVDIKKNQLKNSGHYSPEVVESIFVPTYCLAVFLHSQSDTNRLKNQFPDV